MKKILMMGLVMLSAFIIESCGPSELTVSSRPETPYYVRPVSPGPDYVWIDGDWHVRNSTYYWTEGRWVRPGNRIWMSGSWQSRNGGWYWRRGHWQ